MTKSRTIEAVLFDVDGTLVDSNYLHVDTWQRAFLEEGESVDAWRVHQAIGQASARLIPSLIGERDEEVVERLTQAHSTLYLSAASRLRTFRRVQQLLRELSGRGLRVVLATSAAQDELQLLRRTIDCDDAIAAATSADDVARAKPAPDILQAALERAGVEASAAIFIGDSVWDMKAAANAEVPSFGVLCGGIAEQKLRDAGATDVFIDPSDLLDGIDRLGL